MKGTHYISANGKAGAALTITVAKYPTLHLSRAESSRDHHFSTSPCVFQTRVHCPVCSVHHHHHRPLCAVILAILVHVR